MKQRLFTLIVLMVVVISVFNTTLAQDGAGSPPAPESLSGQAARMTYQGSLRDSGLPANGTYNLIFTLYDHATVGTVRWTETHSTVTVTDGLYTVVLGGSTAFGNLFREYSTLYMEVTVNSTPLTPRQPMTGVPYAFNADHSGSGSNSFIGGGGSNTASGTYATMSGGFGNAASFNYSTIGGGYQNQTNGLYGTVAGGANNIAGSDYAAIGGGSSHGANGPNSAISGGSFNLTSGTHAAVGGGYSNSVSGSYGTIPGGYDNTASGDTSFAAGDQASATHLNSFVWGASNTTTVTASYADYTFTARAPGGARFYTAHTGITTGVNLPAGGGAWASLSDRSVKDNVTAVDPRAILDAVVAMPISTWNYESQDDSIRHIGPMAQDFYSAFGVGEDDRHITTVDADGVALAAIQGLYAENQALRARIEVLEQGDNVRSGGLDLSKQITILMVVTAISIAVTIAALWTVFMQRRMMQNELGRIERLLTPHQGAV